MLSYLVVMSQFGRMGRGVNGHTLYKFLRCYFDNQSVAITGAHQLLSESGELAADTVFLGLPSTLRPENLRRLRFRRLILFDLFDESKPQWDESNRDHLREHADMYLKPWHDQHWDYGIRMGLAPIRRYEKLRTALRCKGLFDSCRMELPRNIDVAFLGAPTGAAPYTAASGTAYQRVEWLLDVIRKRPDFRFWGGLFGDPRFLKNWKIDLRQEIEERYGNVDDLFINGKVNFYRYFAALCRSKVLLTPKGWAPWSYRHYEAIYAGAAVVTSDFRHLDTLIPLPKDGMLHVKDGESVLPAIEQAIHLQQNDPGQLEANVRFLERYLDRGAYSRIRPALLDRFLGQLPEASHRGWRYAA